MDVVGDGIEVSKLLEDGGAVSSRLFQAVVGLVVYDVPVGFGQDRTQHRTFCSLSDCRSCYPPVGPGSAGTAALLFRASV